MIIANDEEDIDYMLRKLTDEYEKCGISMNMRKTDFSKNRRRGRRSDAIRKRNKEM